MLINIFINPGYKAEVFLYHPCSLPWRWNHWLLPLDHRQIFTRVSGEEKIALYANYILLFLGDTRSSLSAAMDVIIDFGQFSSLNINWDKSMLLPVDIMETPLPIRVPQMEMELIKSST